LSKAVIVYATRYGSTGVVSQAIVEALKEVGVNQVETMLTGELDVKQLESAGLVVIGGPIYAGRILVDIPRFCESHRELLLQRSVGLFITCLYDGEQATTQLVDAYPAWLHAHACARADLGGKVKLQQLKFIDRFLMRHIAKVGQDVDRVRHQAVRSFATELAVNVASVARMPGAQGE
jgi:menaquinone-dependent protoporphyrinogen oxidase